MRIAYLIHWTGGASSGVTHKVAGQVGAWLGAGVEARVHAYGRPEVRGFADVLARQGVPVEFEAFDSVLDRASAISRIVAQVDVTQPSLVYWRQDLWHPAIERLAQRYPMIIEVNSDDVAEARLGNPVRRRFHLATRGRILRRAAGAVFVSGELSRSPSYARCSGPSLVLGNGIAIDGVEPSTPPASGEPVLAFVVSESQPWHGLDKVAWLASQRPDWTFMVIGPVIPPGRVAPPPNLRFLGPQSPETLRRTLATADAGLGTLALHRMGCNEMSPLKAREYLAAGLPVVLGYRDTDFPAGAPFILELANDEDNVRRGLAAMDAFVAEWKGRRVPRESIRHLDVRVKEAERLAFFHRVVGPSRAAQPPGRLL